MALADLDEYVALEEDPPWRVPFFKVALATTAGRLADSWTTAGPAGTAPTTAAAPTDATAGALGADMLANLSMTKRILGANISSNRAGTFFLCDRLSHQGGLSGIVTGTVTTNLPTAALTRYTSGEGVRIALSIYTPIGSTATTVTVTYTNQAGTGSRVTPATVLGGTGFREAARFLVLPLQAGDTGVRSVESINVVATTGTAGAFGVTLFKPIAAYVIERPGGQQRFNLVDGMGGLLHDIEANACLFFAYSSAGASTVLAGNLHIAEAT